MRSGIHLKYVAGEIPKELGKLTKLQHLALCNNRLVGERERERERKGEPHNLLNSAPNAYCMDILVV